MIAMSKKKSHIDGDTEDRKFAQRQHAWKEIEDALRDLKFGQVVIVVQDGVIVQIDRVERKRLT